MTTTLWLWLPLRSTENLKVPAWSRPVSHIASEYARTLMNGPHQHSRPCVTAAARARCSEYTLLSISLFRGLFRCRLLQLSIKWTTIYLIAPRIMSISAGKCNFPRTKLLEQRTFPTRTSQCACVFCCRVARSVSPFPKETCSNLCKYFIILSARRRLRHHRLVGGNFITRDGAHFTLERESFIAHSQSQY